MASMFVMMMAIAGPVPPIGQWSAGHADSWCDKGALVADMGRNVELETCKDVRCHQSIPRNLTDMTSHHFKHNSSHCTPVTAQPRNMN